jgi:hypothetical protein
MIERFDSIESFDLSLSALEVGGLVKTFDYTDREWFEIQSCVVGPLTQDARRCLRCAATLYRLRRLAGKEFHKKQQLLSTANFEKISRIDDRPT